MKKILALTLVGLLVFTGCGKIEEEKKNNEQNNGNIQEIKHYHLHLKPYYRKGLILNIEKVYELLS